MFNCDLCQKQYAFVHKLQHHRQWGCKGRPSETCILNSPRRPGSVNLLLLPPTPVKSPEKSYSGIRESEEENEVTVTVDAVKVNGVEKEKVDSEVKLQEV